MAPEFENEEDDSLGEPLTPAEVGAAVVFATDWTVGTILNQLERGNIELGPRFQRRDAWKVVRKSRYIESLALQLPVPHIVLAEHPDHKGSYFVLDGRQRLLALMQFCGLVDASNPFQNFKLKGLEVLQGLEDKTWADLQDEPELFRQFENATVRSVVVRNWGTERLLHLLFTRLNTETTKLNAQELRLAAFAGPFVIWVDDRSVASKGLKRIFKLDAANTTGEARMQDVELLVRYFAFRNCFQEYKGPMRPFLDTACRVLNARFGASAVAFDGQLQDFERAITEGFRIFGDNFGTRFVGVGASTRLNRALLDVETHYLALIPHTEILERGDKFKETVESLLTSNDAFIESVDLTPRHARESVHRFSILGQALSDAGFSCQVTR